MPNKFFENYLIINLKFTIYVYFECWLYKKIDEISKKIIMKGTYYHVCFFNPLNNFNQNQVASNPHYNFPVNYNNAPYPLNFVQQDGIYQNFFPNSELQNFHHQKNGYYKLNPIRISTQNNYCNHYKFSNHHKSSFTPQNFSFLSSDFLDINNNYLQSDLNFQFKFNSNYFSVKNLSSILGYNIISLSSFLSCYLFFILKQLRNPTKVFENLIFSVLLAARLPKSTILIALIYLNQRFSYAKNGEITNSCIPEQKLFTYIIVALMLANKFNDDNTFTNKSWCKITGLSLFSLNTHEMIWLKDCKWCLNVVSLKSNITWMENI